MTNRILAARAAAILRDPGLMRLVGFDLNGLCVSGLRYTVVAQAIEDGRITCAAVDAMPVDPGRRLAPGTVVAALYSPEANTMYFPRETYGEASGYERSTILHEATHALFDLFAGGPEDRVLAVDDESAAVLAQAFYIRLADETDAVHRFTMLVNGPGACALDLADAILGHTAYFQRERRIYVVRPPEAMLLRAAVAREWNLIREVMPDGTERDRTGIRTIYNGVVTCPSCARSAAARP
jgi:hypothetical protein